MISAIVYTSNTGFTKEYAKMLSESLNLPFYSLDSSKDILSKGANIIYLGWLCANKIKGLNKASSLYNIVLTGAVGARLPYDDNYFALLKRLNPKANNLYYLHGGIDYSALKGVKKWILKEASKFIAKGDNKEGQALKKVFLNGGSFVSKKYLDDLINFVKRGEENGKC